MRLTCTFVLVMLLYMHSFAFKLEFILPSDSINNKVYTISKTTQKITIDGKLTEDFWTQATEIDIAYEVEPGENIPAPVKTLAYLIHNQTHLFVGFKAYDPQPEKIRAHFTDRDKLYHDDWVGIVLDTYNDERRSFDFICNPFGIQCDAIETDDFDDSWDAIWNSHGRITDEGYVVEMSIPFSSLRFQNKKEKQVWGFDAVRNYPRLKTRHMGAFKRDRKNNCYLCQSIKLLGFEDAKPGKNIELAPTLSLNLNQSRVNGTTGDFNWDHKKLEPGFTGKWGITPNITFSTTLNPDFSHVEADAALLDVNEPFALYFAEKRPFFTEGSDFFDTKIKAIYTRSLRNPGWGLKLTGKEKSHTIGTYIVKDDVTNLIFPGSQGSRDSSLQQHSYSSVLRYKKDFGNKYTLGILLTDRQGENYFNRVYGLDANLRVSNKDRISFMVGGSSTKYPEKVVSSFDQPKNTFSDKVIDFSYNHDSRNLDYFLSYEFYGDHFRADQGFIPQVGYEELMGGGDYTWINKNSKDWWTNFTLASSYGFAENMENDLLREIFESSLTFIGTMQMHALVEYTYQKDLFHGKYFSQNKLFIHNCARPVGNLHLFANLVLGDQIDYANIRLAKRFHYKTGFTYSIGKHFTIDYSFLHDELNLKGNNIYKVNISDATFEYQFTKQLFLRTILQYRHYKYNVAMYDDPPSPKKKSLFSQTLLSYKINPQTVVFLGYSDNYKDNDDFELVQTNKNFFFKIGYAFSL